MKKRLLSWLLTAAMTVSMVPTTMPFAFAADKPAARAAESSGVVLGSYTKQFDVASSTAGEDILIEASGTYRLTGTNTGISVAVSAPDVTLVLDNLTLSNNKSPIQLIGDASVTIVLKSGTTNALNCTATAVTADSRAEDKAADTQEGDEGIAVTQGNNGITAGIHVPENATLTIDKVKGEKAGALSVTGGYGGAGIGGGAATPGYTQEKGLTGATGGSGGWGGRANGHVGSGGAGGEGGLFGKDAEKAGTVTIHAGTLTITGGQYGAGIGGGRGADGQAPTDKGKNGTPGSASTSDGTMFEKGGNGGGSGGNGGNGGNGGKGGSLTALTVTGGTLTVKGGTHAAGIGGGAGGTGGAGGEGGEGALGGAGAKSMMNKWGGNGGAGSHGAIGFQGASPGGNGGAVTISGGRIDITGYVAVGAGRTKLPDKLVYNPSSTDPNWKYNYNTGRTNGYTSGSYGGNGGGNNANTRPQPEAADNGSLKIENANVTLNNTVPEDELKREFPDQNEDYKWDGVNTNADLTMPNTYVRPTSVGTGETVYNTKLEVFRLDRVTKVPNADVSVAVHPGESQATAYTYRTVADEKGVASMWLPKSGQHADYDPQEGWKVSGTDVSHKAIGRILKDQYAWIPVAENDSNTAKVYIGVDIAVTFSPKDSHVYDKSVDLLIDGTTVPEDMNITKLRWFREKITNNDTEYAEKATTSGTESGKLAYTSGFNAASLQEQNKASSDKNTDHAGIAIPMDPEQALPDGTKPRKWTLPVEQNGRYWVELTYQYPGEDEQTIVKLAQVNNIFKSYPITERGKFVLIKDGVPLRTQWFYGSANKYVPLLMNNGMSVTTPYGFAWDLDGYNENDIGQGTMLAEGKVQDGYDTVTFHHVNRYLNFYTSQLGGSNVDLSESTADQGVIAKPFTMKLNHDFLINNDKCDVDDGGIKHPNQYTITYAPRDGALNVFFASGQDEDGNQLWDQSYMFSEDMKDFVITAIDWPNYKVVKGILRDNEGNETDVVANGKFDKDTMGYSLIGADNYTDLTFTYKKATTNVTVKAYYDTAEGEPEREIEGFVPYTVEAAYGKDYTPTPLTIDGYECTRSNLTDGKFAVKDPATAGNDEEINVIKFYFKKASGNVTYRAVVKGANPADDVTIWTKDIIVKRGEAPKFEITDGGTQVPPTLKNFVKKANVDPTITRKDNGATATVYDGVYDLYVTYEYEKKTKDVTIKAVDLLNNKEITLEEADAKLNKTTGENHTFTAPDLSAKGYKAVGQTTQSYFVEDADTVAPTVTFYYMPTTKAPITVTLVYTDAEGHEQTIQVLRNEVEWNSTTTMQAPNLKGYTIVEGQDGVIKTEDPETHEVKYTLNINPTRDPDGSNVQGTTAKIKYRKDAPVTIKVELKEKDVADSDLSGKLLNWKDTFEVEKGADATATAPSIPGYKLATMDGNTTTKKLTATDIANQKTTITFYYEKIGVNDLVKINVKGINDADNNKVLYSYQKLVPVGAGMQEITAFPQSKLKLDKGASKVGDAAAQFKGETDTAQVSLTNKNAGEEISVEFHYKSNMATVTVQAMMYVNGQETTDKVSGFTDITFQAEVGSDLTYAAPSLPGYSNRASSLNQGDKVSENGNTITFYYSKDEGLITYRAVDEDHPDKVVGSYTESLQKDKEVLTVGKQPTMPNYRLDTERAPEIVGAVGNKFDGKNPVTVTYYAKRYQKSVKINLVDDTTHTKIKQIDSALQNAGEIATIQQPDTATTAGLTDYKAVGLTEQKCYITDDESEQEVTFYYVMKDTARPTITIKLVDEKNQTISSYTMLGNWDVATMVKAPILTEQGYSSPDQKTVTVIPQKDTADSCFATIKYQTDYVNVTVNIKSDAAKLAYEKALGKEYNPIYKVKKYSDFAVTAPTIPGYTLTTDVSNKMNWSWTKIQDNQTVTFNYDEVNNVTTSVHTIIGQTEDHRQLYKFTNTVAKNDQQTPYTATEINGYTVAEPKHSLSNANSDEWTFIYSNNAARVKVVAVDESGIQLTGVEPVIYSGYSKGETGVTVRAMHVPSYYLKGYWNGTAIEKEGSMTHTLNLDPTNPENVVKFAYAETNSNWTFTLHCADDDEIIKVVPGVKGQTYSPKTGELNLTDSGFNFYAADTRNDEPFKDNADGEIQVETVTGSRNYDLYYKHQMQRITYEFKVKDGEVFDLPASVTNDNPTTARVNENLTVVAPQVPGYTAVVLSKPVMIRKQAGDAKQKIVIEYNKKSSGTITVEHVLNDGSTNGRPISSYTVSVSEGEWFTANALTDDKYTLAAGQQAAKTVQATAAGTTVTFKYDANFVTVNSFTNVDGATDNAYGDPVEVVKNRGVTLTPPSLTGYVLKGIKVVSGASIKGGTDNWTDVDYVNGKVILNNLTNDTQVYYYYKTFNEAIPEYQVKIKVVEKYEFFTLREDTYTVDKTDDGVQHKYAYNSYKGYKLKSFTIDGAVRDMTENFTGAQVAHDQNHTITYTYVLDNGTGKDDNKVVVPGPDGKIPTGDDVTIKPTNPVKPSVDKDTGTVTVPDGGATVVTPNGTVVVPGGSTIDKNGTITDPNGNVIKPGQPNGGTNPDDTNVKYYFIQYLANGGVGESYTQMVKKGESVELKSVASLFTRKGYTATGWNTNDQGLGNSYTAGSNPINKNLVLYAQWKADEVPSGTYTAKVVLKSNGASDQPDVEQTIASDTANPILATLQANPFTVKTNLAGWTFRGWNTAVNGTGTYYADQGKVSVNNKGTLPLYAQWAKTGADGSITVPGKDNIPGTDDDVTVKPGNGGKLDRDDKGTITVPGTGGSAVKKDNEIDMPNGGTVKPDGEISIKQPDGSTITIDKDGNASSDKEGATVFCVTYNSGDAGLKPVKVYSTSSVTVSKTVFTREGYVFGYWTNDDGGATVNVDTTLMTNTTLTAHWYAQGEDGSITVPGANNKDVIVKPGTDGTQPDVKNDGTVTIPGTGPVETPDGPVIVPEGSVVKPDGSVVNGNDKLYPTTDGATPTDYIKVTYNSGIDNVKPVVQLAKGTATILPNSPFGEVEGKTFLYWNGENGKEFTDTTVTVDTVLTAQWKKTGSVILSVEDGSKVKQVEVEGNKQNILTMRGKWTKDETDVEDTIPVLVDGKPAAVGDLRWYVDAQSYANEFRFNDNVLTGDDIIAIDAQSGKIRVKNSGIVRVYCESVTDSNIKLSFVLVVPGDINKDGLVDLDDVDYAVEVATKSKILSDSFENYFIKLLGDMDKSGEVDLVDVNELVEIATYTKEI